MPRHLIEGLRRFREDKFPGFREQYRRLVDEGQTPTTLFIGCSDSRVVPHLLMGTGPGQLFITRNIGAFVPPYDPGEGYHGTAATIEYATLVLGVTDIVVCGHSHCGAIRSAYEPVREDMPHSRRWLELCRDACVPLEERAGEVTRDVLCRTEQRSIIVQLERLMTYPAVRERADAGTLALHGWHYILEDGAVLALDVVAGAFLPSPLDMAVTAAPTTTPGPSPARSRPV
jgi:carbonic anhydrase